MAGRRAITEEILLDNDDEGVIDINALRDNEGLPDIYDQNEDDESGGDNEDADSDVDDIDFKDFKGIYFNDDPNRKY